ncbi:MAG: hypothetical protein ACQEVA_20360 [Myxococcota bacterium]
MLQRHLTLVLLVVVTTVLTAGCASKQAIKQANQYAQQGKWRQAYAECERAHQLNPDNEEAQKCVADTRPKATSAALEDARSELAAQRYAAALDHIDYVDSIHDEPPKKAVTLRKDVKLAVRDRLETYIANGEMERAYAFAGEAAEIYGDAEFVERGYEDCYEHFAATAKAHEMEDDYAEAIAALAVIQRHDPARADEAQREQERIETIWAEELEAEALALEKDGKTGGAVVMYAKAYELAGREKSRVQLRRLADELRARTTFGVQWTLDGPRDWERSFEKTLQSRIEGGKPAVVQVDDDAKLQMEFDLEKSDCADEATDTSRASTEYVSGTKRVPNPDYDRYEREANAARDDLSDAREEEDRLARELDEAERDLSNFRSREYEPALDRLEDAEQRERDFEARVESARQFVDEAEAQLRRLERDENVSEETIDGQRRTVQTLRRDLTQKETRYEDAQDDRQQLEREFRDAQSELEDLQRRRDRVFDDHRDAQSRVAQLEDDVSRLQSKLRSTPQTLEEDVIDTFNYEVTNWKRTCEAEVQLSALITDMDKDYTMTLEATASTEDAAHPAHPEYGVTEDPLAFPSDDVELYRQVDEKIAQRAEELISGHARKFWNRRLAQGVEKMDSAPHAAADILLAVYLTSPKTLDSGEKTAMEEHLEEYYGASPLATIAE